MNKQLTPQEIGRRKKMDNQIFKFGILTIAVLFIISLMFSNLTDTERESDSGTIDTVNTNIAKSTKKSESPNVSEPKPRKEEPRDYSEINYKLPRTDYLYRVKIVDFQTVLVKDAFTMKAGEYAIPTKENGYLLSSVCKKTPQFYFLALFFLSTGLLATCFICFFVKVIVFTQTGISE